MPKQHILVTGGAGFIGSHMIVELLEAGHQVTAIDNLSNSTPASLARVAQITGHKVPFIAVDMTDGAALDNVFANNKFDAVIHFAALKSVDASVAEPLLYYRNNLLSTLNLCQSMQDHGVTTLIFSSTAALYGEKATMPLTEESLTAPASPYGQSKLMMEQILKDVARANPEWRITILRYFNPVGAHPSGLIGEDPNGPPANLTPYITQVIVGRRPALSVFGTDYPTPDGTCIRDYIHITDLVRGHLAALEHPAAPGTPAIYNLGTGKGHSVWEVLHAFEEVIGRPIPHQVMPRRPGDIPVCYADPRKAEKELGWKAEKTLTQMCADAYHWQQLNPHGYTQSPKSPKSTK